MDSESQLQIAAQIDRICDSDRFRSARGLVAVLRTLAAHLTDPGDERLDQRALASRAFGLDPPFDPAANPRVRVQVTRLRRALDEYYQGPGALDPLLVQLPRRSYRLRIAPRGRRSHLTGFRAVERATLFVPEFIGHSLPRGCEWMPQALTQTLLVELGRFTSVTAVGPIVRAAVATGSIPILAISQASPESFVLDASIQPGETGFVLNCRLLDGAHGEQVWASSMPLDAQADPSHGTWRVAVATLAQQLADESGVVAFEILRASAGKPVERLTVHEAVAAVWRYWITGLAADLEYATRALEHVVAAVPQSGLALAFLGAIRCEAFIAAETTTLTLPPDVVELFERARSLAPGDRWVELLRCYGLMFSRQTGDISAAVAGFEQLPASGSFVGMLGTLFLCLGELDRAESLLVRSLADTPRPPYLYALYRALIAFTRDDIAGASAALEQVSNGVDPVVQIVRAAVACRSGSLAAGRACAEAAVERWPAYWQYCEYTLRRYLPDRVVDALAVALEPLELGWFQESGARRPMPVDRAGRAFGPP